MGCILQLATHQTEKALEAYHQNDSIHYSNDAKEKLIQDWIDPIRRNAIEKLSHSEYPVSTSLILAHTNQDVKDLNTLARLEMQKEGLLDDTNYQFTISKPLNLETLDQFSRNMFRELPESYATDSKALSITKYAITKKLDEELSTDHKMFLYMPLMHSENLEDQKLCVQLFKDNPKEKHYAEMHLRIIERFGRFPHRNNALGRKSTEEELQFLTTPNSSF